MRQSAKSEIGQTNIFPLLSAVIPATNAPENEAVFRLIADNKANDRTIGVITKCDKIDGDPGKV